MKRRIFPDIILVLFCIFIIIFYHHSSQIQNSDQPITVTDYKLNTYVTITIYDSNDTALLDECMAICDQYELLFSRTNPESELYKLNNGLLPLSKDGYYSVSF